MAGEDGTTRRWRTSLDSNGLVAAEQPFAAGPGDQEQRVVDRQPQAQHGDDVDGLDRDVSARARTRSASSVAATVAGAAIAGKDATTSSRSATGVRTVICVHDASSV